MPKKRPIADRVSEAKQKVERLQDEQRMAVLRQKIKDRQPRRRRR